MRLRRRCGSFGGSHKQIGEGMVEACERRVVDQVSVEVDGKVYG